MHFVFITGGVSSSLGKGLASASLASLLQLRKFKVRVRKLDPYLNVDPGTMSPYQHGEVFVTDDGAETDLDLGHYERFTNKSAKKSDSISSGKIYSNVLSKERKGDYLGATIQVIPHVTDEIKLFMNSDLNNEDFIIYEIGGTVGVSLNASGTTDPEGDNMTFNWTSTDGKVNIDDRGATTIEFDADPGTYNFQLDVTDSYGASSSEIRIVDVSKEPNSAPKIKIYSN